MEPALIPRLQGSRLASHAPPIPLSPATACHRLPHLSPLQLGH
jgi:hypothetical protein